MHRTRVASYALAMAGAFTVISAAQLAAPGSYAIDSFVIAGGGGTSSSGGAGFSLSGTIGQHDAGIAMSGGGFTLQGGFWIGGGLPTIDTCLPDIAPLPTGNGLVNVDDLLAVINTWGNCADPNQCPADIAPAGPVGGPIGNDIVNVDDLLAVINGWGTCR